jgi:hypothetical protein
MTYDPKTRALGFASEEELGEFHDELSRLVRSAMVSATRHIEDPHQAKAASREVMKEFRALIRTLNVLRGSLTPRAY